MREVKKVKTLFVIACCAILCKSSAIESDALAETVTVGVTAELAGSYSVLIPKTIVLDGSTGIGEYAVGVKGDLPAGRIINIQPSSTVELRDVYGDTSVTASISQSKTSFEYSELNTDTYSYTRGSIGVQDVSAGLYKGSVVFYINTEYIPGLYDSSDTMICRWEDSGINIEKDYTYSNYKSEATSGYCVLNNSYPETRKVILPSSVTTIGERAFSDCAKLTDITIPSSVTSIGWYAFVGCENLQALKLPESLRVIGQNAFYRCSALKTLSVPRATSSISDTAFGYCGALESIVVSEDSPYFTSRNNSGEECNALIRVSNKKLLRGCASTVIPEGIKSIADNAFYRCVGLSGAVIPDSVTDIGQEAFSHCEGLLSVVIQSGVETIGQCAFDGCTSLTSITIPDSVITIGNSAFWGCTSLTSVSIPDSVITIGEQVFSACTNLANIIIGNSVTTIGYCAFNRCTSLNSVTIPDSVTKIEGRVFNECNNLSSVTIGNSIATIGKYAFYNCSKLVSVSYGGKAYTSKSALTSAMTTGGVAVESDAFIGTALAD